MAVALSVVAQDSFSTVRRKLGIDKRTMAKIRTQTVNKTLAKGKLMAARDIRSTTKPKLKAGEVKAKLREYKATWTNGTAKLRANRLVIPAVMYPHAKTVDGVGIKLPTGRWATRKGAFMAKVRPTHKGYKGRGHTGIFYRFRSESWAQRRQRALRVVKRGKNTGKKYRPNLPIKEWLYLHTSHETMNRRVWPIVDRTARSELPKQLRQAVRRYVPGARLAA